MEDKLLEIVNDILSNNDLDTIENYSDQLSLRDDLGFDSFQLAELTVHIEEEFDVDVFQNGIVSTLGEIKEKLA